MQLFLFNFGLATFSGRHTNTSLLFQMHKIFESLVADSFNHYQNDFVVKTQGPKKYMAANEERFPMRSDIHLDNGKQKNILDAKWKEIISDAKGNVDSKISSGDIYQVFAYGKKYDCQTVGLIYPKTRSFHDIESCQLDDGLELKCYPFDVTNPQDSVKKIIEALNPAAQQAA